ncbi:hypothetical protein FOCC_FOCC007466 [Frankliniella occidentalis]|nr:hypothetical protein FOCC_FOCC007466 [Frankliniella occidentalis]
MRNANGRFDPEIAAKWKGTTTFLACLLISRCNKRGGVPTTITRNEVLNTTETVEDGEEMYSFLGQNHKNKKQGPLFVTVNKSLCELLTWFMDVRDILADKVEHINTEELLLNMSGKRLTKLYDLVNVWGAAKLRAEQKVVLCTASSGIAAINIEGGRTAHSMFRLPLDFSDGSKVWGLTNGSQRADMVRHASLIWLDEAPMLHRYFVEIIDRSLRDLMKVAEPFGGKVVVLSGDFRQLAPVVPYATTLAEIAAASLRSSPIFPGLRRMHLTVAHRQAGSDDYVAFLMQDVEGDEIVCASADFVHAEDLAPGEFIDDELLHQATGKGVPPDLLRIKKGAVCMITRNLNSDDGLVNGSKVIVVDVTPRLKKGDLKDTKASRNVVLNDILSKEAKRNLHWFATGPNRSLVTREEMHKIMLERTSLKDTKDFFLVKHYYENILKEVKSKVVAPTTLKYLAKKIVAQKMTRQQAVDLLNSDSPLGKSHRWMDLIDMAVKTVSGHTHRKNLFALLAMVRNLQHPEFTKGDQREAEVMLQEAIEVLGRPPAQKDRVRQRSGAIALRVAAEDKYFDGWLLELELHNHNNKKQGALQVTMIRQEFRLYRDYAELRTELATTDDRFDNKILLVGMNGQPITKIYDDINKYAKDKETNAGTYSSRTMRRHVTTMASEKHSNTFEAVSPRQNHSKPTAEKCYV